MADQETIKDLIELLQNPKLEIRKQALMIVLQFSQEDEQRTLFNGTQIMKLLLRLMQEETLESTCLSNLINFTQDYSFCEKLIELNGVSRLIDAVKEDFIQIQKNINEQKYDIEEQIQLVINLKYLILSNLTQYPPGISQCLQLSQPEHKGINFSIMFETFIRPELYELTNNFGSILANLSANENGRTIIIQKKNILNNTYKFIFDLNKERRVGCLKTIRNIAFEYEQEDVKNIFLDNNNEIIDNLNRYIICVLENSKIMTDKKDEEMVQKIKSYIQIPECFFTKLVDPIDEIITALDIILVLTNIENIDTLLKYDMESLEKTLYIVRKYVSEEFKDKINVILCLFCKINEF